MRAVSLLAVLAVLAPTSLWAVEPGDVVLSELMIDSGAGAPEWLEVHNPGAVDVLLDGCTLSDDGAAVHALDGLTVPAGEYVIIAEQPCVAFDEVAACTQATALETGDLSLNNDQDTVTIACGAVVIDTVSYDWPALEGDCVGADSCSANLAPELLNATDNDDWDGAWCVPASSTFVYNVNQVPMISTPGRPNSCPQAGAACGPGDVVFTELMIAPPTSTREWFELTTTRADGCDVHGCELREGPFSDPEFEPTNEDWRAHTIDAPGNSLFVTSGDYLLFAKSADTVVGDPEDENETDFLYADYRYSTVGLDNGAEGWLHLVCGGVPVDTAPYDWTRFEAGCADVACSVNLLPERETAEGNDALDQWCLAPDDPIYRSSTGLPFTGTPNAPGACLVRPWPGAGEVLFTELMVAPDSGGTGTTIPEWFELTSTAATGVELDGCRIERWRQDAETGVYAPTSTSAELVFGADGTDAGSILAGETVVWSAGRCLDGADPTTGCSREERTYGGISFTNEEVERLDLYCPDGSGGEVLVDRAGYDNKSYGVRSAHSAMFDPSVADAWSLNDEASAWCEASFYDCYATNGEGQCNYGTPGEPAPCETGQVAAVPSGVPGCRCGVGRPLDTGAGALLALLFLLGRWRRNRE